VEQQTNVVTASNIKGLIHSVVKTDIKGFSTPFLQSQYTIIKAARGTAEFS